MEWHTPWVLVYKDGSIHDIAHMTKKDAEDYIRTNKTDMNNWRLEHRHGYMSNDSDWSDDNRYIRFDSNIFNS